MELKHAEQIASLLNSENQLVVSYSAERIIATSGNYLYKVDDSGDVSVFVEVKKVSWYQYEVCHLTVSQNHRGKGFGHLILKEAEKHVLKNHGRIIQCTIREDNLVSRALFQKNGFIKTSDFYYPNSGNNVTVWQKAISIKKT